MVSISEIQNVFKDTTPLISKSTDSSNDTHDSTAPVHNLKGGQQLYNHLIKLTHDMAALKKHGSPQLIDIQSFAERTWRVNLEYENYIARLARERQTLNKLVENIWQQFDGVILPLWRVDDAIVPIYEELASLRKQLESLQTLQDVDSEERSQFLCQIQDRLHEIENENLIDGKIIPPAVRRTPKVPGGQAIVMNLLQKCYRLVRVIQETETVVVAPSLSPLENRLDTIIFDLESILGAYKNGDAVDPLELRMIQEHLLSIDRLQHDGKFLDSTGEIPEGQAIIREKLEQAFDLVHECFINQPSSEPAIVDTVLSTLTNTATETRDTLLSYATGASNTSLSTIQTLYNALKEGTEYVRNNIPTLGTSAATPKSTRSKMVNALRGGLGYSNQLFSKMEPLDESMKSTEGKLISIKNRLKALRNQRISYSFSKLASTAAEDIDVSKKVQAEDRPTAETKQFRLQLEDIQLDLDSIDAKRKDGKFVDEEGKTVERGQAYLMSLMDECYCLVFELLDFDDEAEW
ncbi:hypothetical protein HK098_005881 [Nowakowskiella sp. JEL0407]|nr:hypothetical protein HK098_005881 [Nowakowskiella sp. JEL0407]